MGLLRNVVKGLLLLMPVWVVACSSSATTQNASNSCPIPGAYTFCTCSGIQQNGRQQCQSDGTLSDCTCSPPPNDVIVADLPKLFDPVFAWSGNSNPLPTGINGYCDESMASLDCFTGKYGGTTIWVCINNSLPDTAYYVNDASLLCLVAAGACQNRIYPAMPSDNYTCQVARPPTCGGDAGQADSGANAGDGGSSAFCCGDLTCSGGTENRYTCPGDCSATSDGGVTGDSGAD
ncbi:MAG: hypothetical protein WCI05_06250 [Myxococcales bacterium]